MREAAYNMQGRRPRISMQLGTAYSTAAIAASSFTFGTNLSSLSSLKDVFVGNKEKGLPGLFPMSDAQWGQALSVLCVGAFLTNISVTSVPLNRKHLLVLNNLFYIAGHVLILLAASSYHLILGRLVAGLGSGVTCAVVPLYFQKLAPDGMRSMYGSLHQLSLCIGIFSAQLFSFHFCREDNWRAGMLIVVGYLVLHTLMLCFIARVEDDAGSSDASVISLLMNSRSRWSMLASVLLHGGQQFSGIRAVILYSDTIFKDRASPRLCCSLVGLTLVLGTLVSMFVVGRLGRKTMLAASLFLVIASLLLLSSELYDFLAIFGFIMGYSLGLGPIPWFITGEVFPERYKKAGNLLSVSANWMSTYLIAVFFGEVFKRLKQKVFLVFAGVSALLMMYVLVFFRETKGRKADFL